MKSLTLFFYAVVCYLLGAIASAVAAPYLAIENLNGPSADLTFTLIPIMQAAASLLFFGLALAQLAEDIVANARAQDKKLDRS